MSDQSRELPAQRGGKTLSPERVRLRIEHALTKIATLTIGAVYVSSGPTLLRRRLDRQHPRPAFAARVALVAHAYYTDLIPEIISCFDTFPMGADLILTVPKERADEAMLAINGVHRARVVAVENRGRDIAPFIKLLNDGVLAPYDTVLKIHTKRSPHLRDGEVRRKLIYGMLAGSRRQTAAVLRLFESSATGLVGWRQSWRKSPFYWMNNASHVNAICQRFGCEVPFAPAFFEGSMFWVRPAALKRLAALNLTAENFEPEAGQLDGALQHCIERVFALAAASEGYVVCDLRGRILYGPDAVSFNPPRTA